jgi:hypothetical protein
VTYVGSTLTLEKGGKEGDVWACTGSRQRWECGGHEKNQQASVGGDWECSHV